MIRELKRSIRQKILDPLQESFNKRSERERRLMLITVAALFLILAYNSLSAVTMVLDKFKAQNQRLQATKSELALMLDEQRSPLRKYSLLSKKVAELEKKFKNRLRSEGNIASLEKVMQKHLDPKYFTLNERPAKAFEGGLSKTTFVITFKTGSLEKISKILRDLTEGRVTFSIESLRIEKTFRKYLNVQLDATSMRKGSA